MRGNHHIGLVAQKPMGPGAEIFFDYNYDKEEKQQYGFSKAGKRRRLRANPGRE